MAIYDELIESESSREILSRVLPRDSSLVS